MQTYRSSVVGRGCKMSRGPLLVAGIAITFLMSGLLLILLLRDDSRQREKDGSRKNGIFNRRDLFVDDMLIEDGLEVEVGSVRILCWLVTSPELLSQRAIHVKQTWGRRCDKTLYFSSVVNDSFPTVLLGAKEGRTHSTANTLHALRYIYEHHVRDADWFVKADDNSYIIAENMRLFLAGESTEEPVYFGQRFQNDIPGGYASGGAGYVLSKESLRRICMHGHDERLCRQDGGSEDVEIGICLHNLGVTLGKSVDSKGRSRFHSFDPATHIMGTFPTWYFKYTRTPKRGMSSMSSRAISFHYVTPATMYLIDYFLYHVRPYGRERLPKEEVDDYEFRYLT